MKRVLILLFCFLSFVSFASVTVDFFYDGKFQKYQGVKIKTKTFLYNPGKEKKISLSTLEWPPYIGSDLYGHGWVNQLAAAIFLSQGYTVEIAFYPWARAVMLTELGYSDILFPEYLIPLEAKSDIVNGKKRRELLEMSAKFNGGPIAFFKRKDFDIEFSGDLRELEDNSIGVVSGYENTPKFDKLMTDGFFKKISKAKNDFINLRKLHLKRVQLIIGDPYVFKFLIKTKLSPAEKKEFLDDLEILHPTLAYNHLYLAFSKKNKNLKRDLKIFNETLKKFKKSGEIKRIINKYTN